MNDQLLTITEVAALLRVPVATLRWWGHKGSGPDRFKIGRRIMYRQSDVDKWIDAQRRPAAPPPDTAVLTEHGASIPAKSLRGRS